MDELYTQAIEIIKSLEQKTGIYGLQIGSVPIWWFIRVKFYNLLLDRLESKTEAGWSQKEGMAGSLPQKAGRTFAAGGVFLLRAAKAGLSMTAAGKKRATVLFLAYPGGFKKNGDKTEFDTNIGSVYGQLADRSIIVERPTMRSQDFATLVWRKNVVFLDAFLFAAALKNFFIFLKKPALRNSEKFENNCRKTDFGKISPEWIIKTVRNLADSSAMKVIVQIDAARSMIGKLKPEAIVETASYDSGTVAVNFLAREHNIPIIELQHGFISRTDIDYAYFAPSDYRDVKPLPDKLFVYGQASKDAILYLSGAFSAQDIVVSGFARLSGFLEGSRLNLAEMNSNIRKKIGVDKNAFLATITTQPTSSVFISSFVEKTLPLLDKNTVICVKLHPSEVDGWESSYGAIGRHPQVRIIDDRTVNLYDLLTASDAHATVASTVFIECFALGIPNIILKGPRSSGVFELLPRQDAVIATDDPRTFFNELQKLKNDPVYRRGIIEEGRKMSDFFFEPAKDPERPVVEQINIFLKKNK